MTAPDPKIVHKVAQEVASTALHDAVHVDQWITAVIARRYGDECKLYRAALHAAVARQMATATASWPDEQDVLAARVAELERELQALRGTELNPSPMVPDSRGPLHQRIASDWHTVSATGHETWTSDGYVWEAEYDIEHPDECDRLPYGQECILDRVAFLFGLDDGELSGGPRRARAHIYGPDANGEFEEHIEWGMDAESSPEDTGIPR